jgi:shikimate kinase
LKARLGGRNLYLIGMMGSGKSSTGRPLAQRLGYGFVDADGVVEALAGRPIAQIFESDGEQGFRSLESQVLQAIGERHSLVVATGGGVITQPENWGILHQGIVIWLAPERDQLLARLHLDPGARPLLQERDPAAVLDALLEARTPLYAEADLRITVGDETVNAVTERILEAIPGILQPHELMFQAPNAPQTTED